MKNSENKLAELQAKLSEAQTENRLLQAQLSATIVKLGEWQNAAQYWQNAAQYWQEQATRAK